MLPILQGGRFSGKQLSALQLLMTVATFQRATAQGESAFRLTGELRLEVQILFVEARHSP
jgi:hypothetical protein